MTTCANPRCGASVGDGARYCERCSSCACPSCLDRTGRTALLADLRNIDPRMAEEMERRFAQGGGRKGAR